MGVKVEGRAAVAAAAGLAAASVLAVEAIKGTFNFELPSIHGSLTSPDIAGEERAVISDIRLPHVLPIVQASVVGETSIKEEPRTSVPIIKLLWNPVGAPLFSQSTSVTREGIVRIEAPEDAVQTRPYRIKGSSSTKSIFGIEVDLDTSKLYSERINMATATNGGSKSANTAEGILERGLNVITDNTNGGGREATLADFTDRIIQDSCSSTLTNPSLIQEGVVEDVRWSLDFIAAADANAKVDKAVKQLGSEPIRVVLTNNGQLLSPGAKITLPSVSLSRKELA